MPNIYLKVNSFECYSSDTDQQTDMLTQLSNQWKHQKHTQNSKTNKVRLLSSTRTMFCESNIITFISADLHWGCNCQTAFTALTLLAGHQKEHPACKKLSDEVVVCLEPSADCLHTVQLMLSTASQNPIISCLILIQTGFNFPVLAYPGCPGKEAIKRM